MMWRWLHSLPRAVRHQCHGSGASAGVQLDDLHEKESKQKSTEHTFEWKSHCKQRREWHQDGEHGSRPESHDFWRMVHGTYLPLDLIRLGSLVALGVNIGQFKCLHLRYRQPEGEHQPCLLSRVMLRSMHTSSNALPRAGVLPGQPTSVPSAASASGHSVKQSQYSEATENVPVVKPKKYTAGSETNTTPGESLFCLQAPVVQHHEQQTQTQQAASTSEDIESLEEAFNNFEAVCRKYTAVGKGIMGLQAAESGNIKAAIQLWTESGKLGHAKANFNLALCYELGIGVKKDLGEAIRLYSLGAGELHPQSMYNLGVIYMEGSVNCPKDTKKGLNLISTAADLGLPEAQCYLGVYYTQEGSENASKAIHYLTMAANQQHAEGQYMLGMCYEHGYGVQENICKAADLYAKAAEKSHADALCSLAVFHSHGLAGLPVNQDCSEQLMKKAAMCGSQEAKEILESEKTKKTTSVISQAKESFEVKCTSMKGLEKETVSCKVHLHSSVSTPCLTDLLREHMIPLNKDLLSSPVSDSGTLSPLQTQLIMPRGFTVSPPVTKFPQPGSTGPKENSDSGVLFRLGSDEGAEDDVIQWETLDSVWRTESQGCSSLQRTSTMPELDYLSGV